MSNLSPAQILRKSSDFIARNYIDKAQKQLALGLKIYPNNYEIALAYARIAEGGGQWKNAADRWKYIRQKFPGFSTGYYGGITALLALNKDAEAEHLAQEGSDKFKTDIWFIDSCARVATKKKDFESSLNFYQSLQTAHPNHSRGFTGQIEIFIETERFSEAEEKVAEYLHRFPDDVWLNIGYATLAMRRQDWAEAVRRWDQVLERFPDHQTATELKHQAKINLGE